jgi:chemotaxis family two-component system response regulator Rcp1
VLVEDNPADARLVRRALEEHGVEGEMAIFIDGENAIAFIEAMDSGSIACPDLVIIDLNLPKRPGREVLECMRLSERCSKVPVVILSSSDADEDKADAGRLGASCYLRKPLHLDEFLSLGAVFKATIRKI